MLQHGPDLRQCHPRKPLEELMNGYVVLEILEERSDRYPRATEHPGPAVPIRVLLYRLTR